MRIDLRDTDRQYLGRADVNVSERPAAITPTETGRPTPLNWDRAVNDRGRLVRCVSCGCRDLYRRRDFPQRLGLVTVVVAGLISLILFAMRQVTASIVVLLAVVVVDGIILLFTRQCVVCYRCRTEYRDLEIADEIEPWDLAVGEKYRPARHADSAPGDSTAHS